MGIIDFEARRFEKENEEFVEYLNYLGWDRKTEREKYLTYIGLVCDSIQAIMDEGVPEELAEDFRDSLIDICGAVTEYFAYVGDEDAIIEIVEEYNEIVKGVDDE